MAEGNQDLYLQTGPGVDRLNSNSRDSVPLSSVNRNPRTPDLRLLVQPVPVILTSVVH